MCSLFLGSLSLKKKSQRVVPFAALANFAFARGHGDAAAETAARRFAFAVTAELVAALLRDCETSEEDEKNMDPIICACTCTGN